MLCFFSGVPHGSSLLDVRSEASHELGERKEKENGSVQFFFFIPTPKGTNI